MSGATAPTAAAGTSLPKLIINAPKKIVAQQRAMYVRTAAATVPVAAVAEAGEAPKERVGLVIGQAGGPQVATSAETGEIMYDADATRLPEAQTGHEPLWLVFKFFFFLKILILI